MIETADHLTATDPTDWHRGNEPRPASRCQRVLIARTLAQEADHLLLDEPTNHLDIRYQLDILELVRSLRVVTVVVLHDLNLAARYCEHLVLLDRGRMVCSGPADQVLTPEILEPVYHVTVQRLSALGSLQLVFGPGDAQPSSPRPQQVLTTRGRRSQAVACGVSRTPRRRCSMW